jgi:hypothetical protein
LDEHHRRKASLPATASIREGLGGGVKVPKVAQQLADCFRVTGYTEVTLLLDRLAG